MTINKTDSEKFDFFFSLSLSLSSFPFNFFLGSFLCLPFNSSVSMRYQFCTHLPDLHVLYGFIYKKNSTVIFINCLLRKYDLISQ